MLCDGDTFYTADIVSRYRAVAATHNGTFCFVDTQPKPIYSYVRAPRRSPSSAAAASDSGSRALCVQVTVSGEDDVQDIKEKVKISDYANTGCYCFKNGVEYRPCPPFLPFSSGEWRLRLGVVGGRLERYCEKIIVRLPPLLHTHTQPTLFHPPNPLQAPLTIPRPAVLLRRRRARCSCRRTRRASSTPPA